MLIHALHIQHFKNFEQLNLSQLGRVTLLGGRNNSGKSSVLEALFLAHDLLHPELFLRQLGFRHLQGVTPTPEQLWAPLFYRYKLDRPILLQLETDHGAQDIRITPRFEPLNLAIPLEPKVQSLRDTEAAWSPLHLQISLNSPRGVELEVIHALMGGELRVMHQQVRQMAQPPVTYISASSPILSQEDAERFGMLDILGRKQLLVDFLRIMEPRLTDLSAIPIGNRSVIHGDIGMGRKLPISLMGEGLGRLLTICLAMMAHAGGLVLVDEMENGIHHSTMAEVWQALGEIAKGLEVQLIATTHSAECLEAAHRGFSNHPEAFSFIRLDRTPTGTLTRTYDHEVLGAALAQGWEVRG